MRMSSATTSVTPKSTSMIINRKNILKAMTARAYAAGGKKQDAVSALKTP